MNRKVFINLPVADLTKSKTFFEELGFSFDPLFTNDRAACLIISDTVFAMLITHDMFRTFTPKAICDAKNTSEVLIALTCDSRQAVDAFVAKALSSGGRSHREPQDHGFMYEHSFQDPDGHIWEPFWMDPEHLQKN